MRPEPTRTMVEDVHATPITTTNGVPSWTDGATGTAVRLVLGLDETAPVRHAWSHRAVAAAVVLRHLVRPGADLMVWVSRALGGALPPAGPTTPLLGGSPEQDRLAWDLGPTLARLAGHVPEDPVATHEVEARAGELAVLVAAVTVDGLGRLQDADAWRTGHVAAVADGAVVLTLDVEGIEVSATVLIARSGRPAAELTWCADDLPLDAARDRLPSAVCTLLPGLRPRDVELAPAWSPLAVARAVVAHAEVTGRPLDDPTGHLHWMAHWKNPQVAARSRDGKEERERFLEVLEDVHTPGRLTDLDRTSLDLRAEVLLAVADPSGFEPRLHGWRLRQAAAALASVHGRVGPSGLDALLPDLDLRPEGR